MLNIAGKFEKLVQNKVIYDMFYHRNAIWYNTKYKTNLVFSSTFFINIKLLERSDWIRLK